MALNGARQLRHIGIKTVAARVVSSRGFSAKTGKKGAKSAAPKVVLTQEMKSSTVVGANILKDSADPKILPDSEYPDCLWHLLHKRSLLSELRRKTIDTLPYEQLKRFVKLDNRSRIKENNAVKAQN